MSVFSTKPLRVSLPTRNQVFSTPSTFVRRSTGVCATRSFAAFEGFRSHEPLFASNPEFHLPSLVSNGATLFAMRHRNRVKKLSRPADQRKALIRGLVTEILRHGKIKTTTVKAKAIRPYVDKMINLAKRGDPHARTQVNAFVYDKALVDSLFEKVPERYPDRSSGFTRVIREEKTRRGDNALMSSIELV